MASGSVRRRVLLAACLSPAWPAAAGTIDLVGTWMCSRSRAEGAADVVRFWPEGRFVRQTSRTACETRERVLEGRWRVIGAAALELRLVRRVWIEGGTVAATTLDCDSGRALVGAVERSAAVSRALRVRITRPTLDPRNGLPWMELSMPGYAEGVRFWRYEADPERDAPRW